MEYYKVLMNKMKIQLDDFKDKNKTIILKSDNFADELKAVDEKLHKSKYNINALKRTILEKEHENNQLKEQMGNMEYYMKEKEALEKLSERLK